MSNGIYVTTSSPIHTTETIDRYSCFSYCKNGGKCSMTGPRGSAVCFCTSEFRGERCDEEVLWIEFLVQDGRLTDNGLLAVLFFSFAFAFLVAGYVVFRIRQSRKKSEQKSSFVENTNPIFDEVTSNEKLLVYRVTSGPSHTSNSPGPPPCSPQPQGICYLVPTSPDPEWQDYHNPGYRNSFVDLPV